jgi:phosphoglycolate phosphatase
MNVIFDLDGTLIDSSERMYRLFCDLVPQCELTKEGYWDLKRDKINHKQLLAMKYPNVDYELFNKEWMNRIELEEYLLLDTTYHDTIEVLNFLSSKSNLYLLTARQLKLNLYNQLTRLGIIGFFKKIFVTENKYSKEELLFKEYIMNNQQNCNDFFVSDMGKDIELGNKLGFKTVAITHGFMNGMRLKEYSPNYIINNLVELKTLII